MAFDGLAFALDRCICCLPGITGRIEKRHRETGASNSAKSRGGSQKHVIVEKAERERRQEGGKAGTGRTSVFQQMCRKTEAFSFKTGTSFVSLIVITVLGVWLHA